MSHLAYLDAGTGSAILTMLAGGVAGIAVALKYRWNRFLVFLRIRKPEDVETTTASTDAKS